MNAGVMTVMTDAHGVGPTGMRCENCAHLRALIGKSRIEHNGQAHNSKPLTMFRCANVASEHWSIQFAACGLFARVTR
jgi:hypothetical protein